MDRLDQLHIEAHKRLDDWLELAQRSMRQAVMRTDARDKNALLASIGGRSSGGTGPLLAELLFAPHGRFVDMGAGKGYTKGVRQQGNERSNRSPRGRKPKKIYSKPVYGTIGYLSEQLAHIYVEAAVSSAKKMERR